MITDKINKMVSKIMAGRKFIGAQLRHNVYKMDEIRLAFKNGIMTNE